MTPIESGARTLAARHYANRFGQPLDSYIVQLNVEANWRDYAGEADAVIQAIREPSGTMREAGAAAGDFAYSGNDALHHNIEAQSVWHAMIDAALAEGEG